MRNTTRQNLYAGIHKALRALMAELVTAAGRMDPDDEGDVRATLARIEEGLQLCEKHLQLEEAWLHPAMEARRPGTSARAALDHAGHEREFESLRAALGTVRDGSGAARREAAYELHLALARWMAGNFLHMEHEERHHNAALWDAYSDAELAAIRTRMLATVPPGVMARYQRWMVPSLNHAERVAQFAGIRASAPPEAFAGLLATAASHLPARDWGKLSRALDLAPQAAA